MAIKKKRHPEEPASGRLEGRTARLPAKPRRFHRQRGLPSPAHPATLPGQVARAEERDARRFHRARHDGQGHGGQSAEGRPSARRLRSATAAAAEPSRRKARTGPSTPAGLAEASEVVFTSLPVPADVEAVALGPNGLLEGMKPDTAFFDMSTNSVAVVRKLNAAFAEKNLYLLDAPVSGGPAGAASGKMAIWVGGDQSSFDRHKTVLDAMGDQARYIGPIGAGTIAKLVHNCTSAVVGVAMAEVMTMGIKAGRRAARAVGGDAPRRDRPAAHLRPARRNSCRAATTRRSSRCAFPQGRVAGGRARQGGRRADAPRQPGARGTDRGDEPRLGPARQPGRRPACRSSARASASSRSTRPRSRPCSTPTSRNSVSRDPQSSLRA